MTFCKDTALNLAAEMAEDDERATKGSWYAEGFWRDSEGWTSKDERPHRWRIFLSGHENPRTNSRDCDWTEDDARAIDRLRNNARAAAEQLRGAVEEVERLNKYIETQTADIGLLESGKMWHDAAAERERIRSLLAEACDSLETEGLDETAARLRQQGGAWER